MTFLSRARLLSERKQHGGELRNCWSPFSCFWAVLVYINMYRGSLSSRRLILPCFSVRKSTASSVQGVFDRQNRNDRNVGKSSERDSVKGSAENTFAASSRGSFFQEAPRLRNQYSGDLFLQSYLRRILPTEVGMCYFIKCTLRGTMSLVIESKTNKQNDVFQLGNKYEIWNCVISC